ncbi:glutathione S-transferase family protein [Asticcacaulis sp. EMRT-3]|uniref:FtsZ-binding protein FzlA n=1 Tax=Asticcacaulis sp. EMRT-3 TaxID=3040349 RepID=UPI0024AF1840|nr:glutathione S-transferase family protein [Asticcacaulis sp. EMRT-3]MDI7775587.1 glutathione S-transferase family protein [Asticcacaulis sp. EMRT-3]
MTSLVRQLYHFAFDPHSRLVRLALGEKKLGFEEIPVRYWEPDDHILHLNPSGLLPILIETPEEGAPGPTRRVCENRAILEHLEETVPEPRLLPADVNERAEARRLVGWFERKFDYEVNALLLHEKMEKRLMGAGAPDIAAMRQGREALKDHLRYFESLLMARNWLAGRTLSYADFACAAQLSIIDYFDEINWTRYPHLKTWYMVIKSRPCFRPLLADKLPGVPASAHYKELDF